MVVRWAGLFRSWDADRLNNPSDDSAISRDYIVCVPFLAVCLHSAANLLKPLAIYLSIVVEQVPVVEEMIVILQFSKVHDRAVLLYVFRSDDRLRIRVINSLLNILHFLLNRPHPNTIHIDLFLLIVNCLIIIQYI